MTDTDGNGQGEGQAEQQAARKVRAKFYHSSAEDQPGGGKKLRFEAHYDANIPEDQAFSTATPNGSLEMTVNAPGALAFFDIGKSYYLDFSPAA